MLKADEDTIKTTWRMPKDLVKKYKHLATDRETTVSMLVIDAMKAYLEIQDFDFEIKYNIDSIKKEELMSWFVQANTDGKKVPKMIEVMNEYLETQKEEPYLILPLNKKLDFKSADVNKEIKELTLDRETRVATVKVAMKEYLKSKTT